MIRTVYRRSNFLFLIIILIICGSIWNTAVLNADELKGVEPTVAHTAARPNIILFLVDDLGWQDLSVPLHSEPTEFNQRYRTPNVERLAARGIRFTNAYAAAPVCTPTRTSIMTGQSPGQTHISYWTLNKDKDTSRKHPTLQPPPWRLNGLQDSDITLPRLLQASGYRTIHVGKAYFGARETSGAEPRNLGFDINIAGHASGGPASYYGLQHFTVAGRQGKPPHEYQSVWDIPNLEKYHGSDIYLTEALAIEASQAIINAVADDKPFYLNFAPYAVHAPIMANKRYLENYKDLDRREAAYATMIETYDAALGALVATLQDLGVYENTVIIFASDNGGLSAHARGGEPHIHNAPLRSGKGSAYEGGTRVPTIIAWPGVIEPNSISNLPIVSQDFFPTILEMAGVAIPAEYQSHVEGRNLLPILDHQEKTVSPDWSNRIICWHQPHQWGADGPGIHPFTSIRQGDWKLIYFHAGRNFELYNLAVDIGETNDLAQAQPDKVRELADSLTAWIKTRNVQMSIDKETATPIELPDEAAVVFLKEIIFWQNAISLRCFKMTRINFEPLSLRILILGGLLILGMASHSASADESPGNLTLWYRQPAKTWNEALPLGNGRLGTMVFGRPFDERIQLNEESIWADPPVPENPDHLGPVLARARAAFFDGQYAEGEQIVQDEIMAPRISPRKDHKLQVATIRPQQDGPCIVRTIQPLEIRLAHRLLPWNRL